MHGTEVNLPPNDLVLLFIAVGLRCNVCGLLLVVIKPLLNVLGLQPSFLGLQLVDTRLGLWLIFDGTIRCSQ